MRIVWVLSGLILLSWPGRALGQEEGSADLFTEAYTDKFQEAFFEALKQKGIENYDRAEALMLEAGKYDPANPVVDYELARILIRAGAYARAEPHALEALKSDPKEYWYLETFMHALKAQSKGFEAYAGVLPTDLPDFRLNLGRWYLSEGRYKEAKAQLQPIRGLEQARWLLGEADRKEGMATSGAPEEKEAEPRPSEDLLTINSFESRLDALRDSGSWSALEAESSRAIESFPLQPYFYYCKGLALLRQDRAREAVPLLKEGEGYLLEPSQTGQQIYKALAEAYLALGEPEKARKYEEKAKGGL
jgi:Flp pilus assembly protein TadD